MKQIFDWLREQIGDTAYCEDDGTCGYCQRTWCPHCLVDRDDLDKIIDEAETKWEVVMSELEKELKLADEEKERCSRENPLQFDTAKGYANGISNAIEIIKGKPIKISGVE